MATSEDAIEKLKETMGDPLISRQSFDELLRRVEKLQSMDN